MTDTRHTPDAHDPRTDTPSPGRAGRFRRRAVAAFAGTAALVALSFGMAFAAASDETPATGVESPSEAPTSDTGTTDGGTGAATDGGTDGGSGDVGGTGGAGDGPSPTSTEVTDDPVPPTDPGEGTVPPDPSGGPADPGDPGVPDDLDERLARLEEKVDQLPTKRELADALRAFADELEE